jgi:D-glycero-D-manno-heptose 1,7-bisphosphate phosphatase
MNTLFLDRDGVINNRLPGDYVRQVDDFHFLPGVLEAIAGLSPHFQYIVVVTNQAGIGKGLMTATDLQTIHEHLLQKVHSAGGRVDAIFYCPHRSDAGCDCRKPATGMGFQAQKTFPDLDFSRSWMVGDSISDIQFGQALGMKTALIEGKAEESEARQHLHTDFKGEDLMAFAQFFRDKMQ